MPAKIKSNETQDFGTNEKGIMHPDIRTVKNNEITVGTEETSEFTSIQSAIDAAEDGFIINIGVGTYEESLKINKKLSFIGNNKENVIIQQPKDCVCEISSVSSFKNITFKNTEENIEGYIYGTSPSKEIALVKCYAQVNFENCNFIDSFSNGIIFTNSNESKVSNCKISNIEYRGVFSKKSNVFITNTEVSFTGFDSVVFSAGSIAKLKNCKIHDIDTFGLLVEKKGKVAVENCEIYQSELDGIGVLVRDKGSWIALKNCKVHDLSIGRGLCAGYKGKLTAEKCEIYQMEDNGVFVNEGSEIIMNNCKVYDVSGGLKTKDKGKLIADNCEIYQIKKDDGVAVAGKGSEITIKNSKIHDVLDGYGLFAGDKGKLITENCEIYQTAKESCVFETDKGSNVKLYNCFIHNSGNLIGIWLENEATVPKINTVKFGDGITKKILCSWKDLYQFRMNPT